MTTPAMACMDPYRVSAAHARGFTGRGCRLVVVERGWQVAAGRFPQIAATGMVGGDHHTHGAATLEAAIGPNGAAPGVDGVVLVCQWRPGGAYDTAAALASIREVEGLVPGDVVLVQAQTEVVCAACGVIGGLPVDVRADVAREVDALIAAGFVVVLPAGNGGHTLDSAHACARPGSAAIHVGSARRVDGGWVLDAACNHGVASCCGPVEVGARGTSRAAASLAGLLCVVSGAARSRGVPFTHDGVRAALSASGDRVAGGGVVPDAASLLSVFA